MGIFKPFLTAIVFFWLSQPVLAAEPTSFAIALMLEGYDLGLRYPTQVQQTQLNAITLRWHERISPRIHGGILLGTVDGTQSENPVPVARVTTGNYLGINLYFAMLQSPRFDLGMNLDYRYYDLAATTEPQNAKWRWHQGSVGLDGRLGLSDRVNVVFGLSANALSGEEVLTGTITQVTPFSADHSPGARLGLRLDTDPTGYIGLEMQSGFAQGGRIFFERWF
jgi:hypothetical protein